MKYHPFTIILLLAVLCGCSNVMPDQTSISDKASTSGDYLSCASDSDCICDGTDTSTGRCYLGNRDYYSKNVDPEKDCPDFCTGIAANLVVRCVDNKCIQMFECLTNGDCPGGSCVNNRCITRDTGSVAAVCKTDDDCTTQGCSGQLCMAKSAGRVMTTCEMRPEYDCFKYTACDCVDGECGWVKNQAYLTCLDKLK
jgi:eight-cysteine-cluster-containing protein